RGSIRWSGLVAVVTAALFVPSVLQASTARTVTVCPSGPPSCDYATIQEALDAVEDGDSIRVAPGTYAGGLNIEKSVRLLGSGASQTTISGGDPAGVTISSQSSVVISDVKITDAVYT